MSSVSNQVHYLIYTCSEIESNRRWLAFGALQCDETQYVSPTFISLQMVIKKQQDIEGLAIYARDMGYCEQFLNKCFCYMRVVYYEANTIATNTFLSLDIGCITAGQDH